MAQMYEIFAKVGSQFCQILNSYSRNGQKLFKFCRSGEILPNLVALTAQVTSYYSSPFCLSLLLSLSLLLASISRLFGLMPGPALPMMQRTCLASAIFFAQDIQMRISWLNNSLSFFVFSCKRRLSKYCSTIV